MTFRTVPGRWFTFIFPPFARTGRPRSTKRLFEEVMCLLAPCNGSDDVASFAITVLSFSRITTREVRELQTEAQPHPQTPLPQSLDCGTTCSRTETADQMCFHIPSAHYWVTSRPL